HRLSFPQRPVLESRPAQHLAGLDLREPAEPRRAAARARDAGMGGSGTLMLPRTERAPRAGQSAMVALQHARVRKECDKALDRPTRIGYDLAHSAPCASDGARIEEEERQPVCHSRRAAMCAFSFVFVSSGLLLSACA